MSVFFLQDWTDANGSPRAVVHRDTSNLSWLRLAVLYSRMGVKNNLFHLALNDPELAKYDPHNLTDPSIELKMRIVHECEQNCWYYMREVLRIPMQGGPGIPFAAHRGNISLIWAYNVGIDYISIQPRQTGKAQSLTSLLRTSTSSWITMGEVKVGDKLAAKDGTETTVTGVYPQGELDMYRITFEDGRSTECCNEHFWDVYLHTSKIRATIMTTGNIREYLELPESQRVPISIPLAWPRQTDDVELPDDPYGLGVSTGDKELPEVYMEASPRQKQSLIMGLKASNQYINGQYHTTNHTLAKQIQYIARSIRGKSILTETDDKYSVDMEFVFLENVLYIKSVEYIGKDQAQCIEVDHPDHLYVTDDFIVTHNTVAAVGVTSWVIYIKGRNFQFAMLTKDNKLLQQNVARLKMMRDGLPSWMIHHQTSDTDNKEGIFYKALENQYLTFVAQKDKQAADNVGRGQSIPSLHGDELGFIANIDITYPVIMAATTTASANAKSMGMPHSNIFTTTAARTDTGPGKYAFDIVDGAMPFTEKIYDLKDAEAAIKMVKSQSLKGKINGTWSYLQLGYSHKWFTETTQLVGATEDEIDRDFLNMWKAGTDTSILATDIIARMKASQVEPKYIEIVYDDYIFNWYIPEAEVRSEAFKKRQLVLAMDSSENIGRDFTCLVVLDPITFKTVGTFRCNDSNIIKIGLMIGDFLVRHTGCVFIPERKSTGGTIVDQILLVFEKYGINPFYRIFNQVIQERDKEPFSRIRLDEPRISDSIHRKHLGFHTNAKTRPFLYKNTLNKAARMNAERIYDATIINELSSLSVVNGRVDHSTGNHDDMAIAYLLACWLLFEGRNLHFYGLDVDAIMREVEAMSNDGDKIDPAHRVRQNEIRNRIRHYEKLIESTDSDAIRTQFRTRIFALQNQLDDSITVEPVIGEQVKRTFREQGDVYNKSAQKDPIPVVKVDNDYLSRITNAAF